MPLSLFYVKFPLFPFNIVTPTGAWVHSTFDASIITLLYTDRECFTTLLLAICLNENVPPAPLCELIN